MANELLWKKLRPQRVVNGIIWRCESRINAVLDRLSPSRAICRRYRNATGRKLNLRSPRTFNEKLQWLKLHSRAPELVQLVDKYGVRDYVQKRIGKEYLIPLLGVWQDPRDIQPSTLPAEFILKATHGSGWNIICRSQNDFDWDAARQQLAAWLSKDFYEVALEWPYHNVPRCIIAEEFIKDPDHVDLLDYKFFCFDGTPRMVQVDVDRFTNHTRALFDVEWNQFPVALQYPKPAAQVSRPTQLPEMLAIAKELSRGLPFVRVDLYCVQQRVLFGELTLFPGAGYERFDPIEWDERLGDWLEIPNSHPVAHPRSK